MDFNFYMAKIRSRIPMRYVYLLVTGSVQRASELNRVWASHAVQSFHEKSEQKWSSFRKCIPSVPGYRKVYQKMSHYPLERCLAKKSRLVSAVGPPKKKPVDRTIRRKLWLCRCPPNPFVCFKNFFNLKKKLSPMICALPKPVLPGFSTGWGLFQRPKWVQSGKKLSERIGRLSMRIDFRVLL